LGSAGYRVIAFDQPAHGVSEGKLTGLPDFADVLAEVAWHHGGVAAVIAHSMGGAATAIAIARGLRVARVVTVGASLDVSFYSQQFARWYWMPQRALAAMQAAVEERFGVPWSELEMTRLAPRLNTPALMIHDRSDRLIPWRQGAIFARRWPGARLLSTRGLGHRRILQDEGVISAAAQFIDGRASVAGVAVPALPNPAPLY
jgi:pimeloyl-ACP methyl ester carboxylesterase